MPTLTVNPTDDGWAGRQSAAEENWATRRAGAGDLKRSQSDGPQEDPAIRQGSADGQWNIIRRGIFIVDTSALPDNATITAVKLRLFVESVSTGIPSQALTLVNAAPASDSVIAASDYGNVGTIVYGDSLTIGGLATAAYNEWNFNATGISIINKAGVTKFGLIHESDRANSEPGFAGVNATSGMLFNFGNAASNKSELVITYVVPDYQDIMVSNVMIL